MLLPERDYNILTLVNSDGSATVRELAELCDVTEVTIRRDLKRLEDSGLLQRTHGGAVSIERLVTPTNDLATEPMEQQELITDALIITPNEHRDAHTLRERALRQEIPLIAEAVPQEGAIYIGIDNYRATHELGEWTGEQFLQHHSGKAFVLDITHKLPNTRERSKGFRDGIISVLGEDIDIVTVEGRGLYNDSYQIAIDALRLHPATNIIFGINDDSVLAGVQAYLDLGRDPAQLIAVNIGGEGKTIFDNLTPESPLKACVAMFPKLVGRLAIDAITHMWQGVDIASDIITPTVLLTPSNIKEYYLHNREGWHLRPEIMQEFSQYSWIRDDLAVPPNKHITFSIIYRTHEWYQNLTRFMRLRAEEVGVGFSVVDMNKDIRNEIRDLRRLIGKMAASYINDGDTIILDAGTTTMNMAQFLKQRRNITVISNSPDIFQQLRAVPGIKLLQTGGEFDPETQCFVGHNTHLFLNEIRADKAFIVAGGVSASFGLSSVNAREAEVRRSIMKAAREVIVLADHTVLGEDSNVRVSSLENVNTVITDAGISAQQHVMLTQFGIEVMVVGQVAASATAATVKA